jgi:two-component system KDP operon response regulator KdpE
MPVPLKGHGYRLLEVLFQNADRRCTRQQLIEQAFGEKYDERDLSQISRLNTAIRRLREKIEPNPDQPQYLRSTPGGGYRLVPRGESQVDEH